MKPHMSAKQWDDLLEISKKFNNLKPSKPFSKITIKTMNSILDGFDLKSIFLPSRDHK